MLLDQLVAALRANDSLKDVTPRRVVGDVEITDVVHDSGNSSPGALFCAIRGATVDGHTFAEAALGQGAVALMVDRLLELDAPQVVVPDVRAAMAHAAASVHGHPSRELAVFGVTGTNGKTTTTQMLAAVMESAGRPCTVIGTLGGVHTTPESTDLQRRLRSELDAATNTIALEVSSHALDQHRADAIEFDVVAFSNLTPDHLDYHGDMEAYFEAKRRLFDGRGHVELVNVDDPWGARLAADRPRSRQVSLRDVELIDETILGTRFRWRGQVVAVGLPGRMNAANALMAAEAARALGVEEAVVAEGLASVRAIPGRMEAVERPGPDSPTVIVDYSHTPDSIERALAAVRAVAPAAKVSIVFGCGGDRDRLKRPLMGRAAEVGADRVYVTSDNPRSEDPMDIIADAVRGMENPDAASVDPDRRQAIRDAIMAADPDDVVLIAGKGHEKTQTIGLDVLPFDDVTIAHDALREVGR